MHMASNQLSTVLQHIRKLAGARAAGTLTDGQLLGVPAGPMDHGQKPAAPDTVALIDVDPLHYRDDVVANAEGRITLPALISGVTYRISGGGAEKEFTIEAGKTIELPDMTILYPGQ
jgi:hypothetical protein